MKADVRQQGQRHTQKTMAHAIVTKASMGILQQREKHVVMYRTQM